MGNGKDNLKLVRLNSILTRNLSLLLTDLYKSLKAISFYPESHPLREELLATAYKFLKEQVKEKELVLVINRAGISSTDEQLKIETNQMVTALAGELFIRRTQRLTFLRDSSLADLRSFLQLLSLDPKKLAASGGIAQLMVAQGIRTIWANEINLSVILEKRQSMEEENAPCLAFDDCAASKADPGEGEDSPACDPYENKNTLQELLSRLNLETDDGRYQQLGRMLATEAEKLKANVICAPLFPVLEALMRHDADESRSALQRDYAVFVLEQISSGVMTDFLLQQLESGTTIEIETIYPILKKLGAKVAYGIIQRLCLADALFARKALASALLIIGLPAVPPLVAMLKDERWYVVRNMVGILGQIGNRGSVNALRPALFHGDQRVRKETIHALVKTGGDDAESMIIGLLDDEDQAIVLHAIMALGLLKSNVAVPLLIRIVEKPDFFSKRVKKRKEAIQSLGRIGDKKATSSLLKVLEADSWLPWNKWDDLKVMAANALGRIEDETALSVLKNHAARGGRLGKACSDAVDNIERVSEGIYG